MCVCVCVCVRLCAAHFYIVFASHYNVCVLVYGVVYPSNPESWALRRRRPIGSSDSGREIIAGQRGGRPAKIMKLLSPLMFTTGIPSGYCQYGLTRPFWGSSDPSVSSRTPWGGPCLSVLETMRLMNGCLLPNHHLEV